jgi:hypothetical protein
MVRHAARVIAKLRATTRGVLLLAIIVASVACSGGGSRTRGEPSLDDIRAAMDEAGTARYRGGSTTDAARLAARVEIRGVASFRGPDRYVVRYIRAGETQIEQINTGSNVYTRGNAITAVLGTESWCRAQEVDETTPLNADMLFSSNARLQWIGEEPVNGVSTRHYKVEASPGRTEIWIDPTNRVVRWRGHGDQMVITWDFYDFGAQITPITAPVDASVCPQ